MAKFVFKMEQLLNIKRQLEESVKNDLAKAIREIEKQKQILNNMQSNKEEHIRDIREQMLRGISVQKLKEFNSFISAYENKIIKQKKVLSDVEFTADKIRERLVQVVKEKKMLEILREKKLAEFKYNEQKKEEVILGEIASYKYIERKVGEENGS